MLPKDPSLSTALRGTKVARRSVLRGALGAVLGCTLPGTRGALAAGPAVVPVRDSLVVVTGVGGNVLVRATPGGQALVDSGAAEHRTELLDALASLPGAGRVDALLNTHWHPEQIGANAELGRAGATIVAHDKTRLRLAVGYYVPDEDRHLEPAPAAAQPTVSFRERHDIDVGGERAALGYLLEAHTDGDIFVHFESTNVVAVGDAVSPVRDPAIDWFGGGWLGGRVDSLALLLELGDDDTLFVPSHGPVLRRDDIRAEHELMRTLFERTTELLRQGYSAADMLAAGVLDGLPRRFDAPGKFLYDVHKSLWAHHNTISHDIV